jgi:hypothetical protein
MTEGKNESSSPIIRETDEMLEVRVLFPYPEPMQAVYANNLTIQHTPLEFLLSFYQVFPPPTIEGDPQDARKKIHEAGGVPAQCVARVAIPKEQMPVIVDALVGNLKKYRERVRPSGQETGQGEQQS